MKKLLVLAVACTFASPAFAGDLKWNGSVGTRYSHKKLDDSLGATGVGGANVSVVTTKKHDIRANLGVTGGSDHLDYGFGLRTGSTTTANSDWAAYNADSADLSVTVGEAYFRYSNDYGFGDLDVTFGRAKNVFAHDTNGEFLFDNDVRFNGFGWKWKMGNFGFNASQYILGARNRASANGTSSWTKSDETTMDGTTGGSGFGYLFGFQPTFNFRFSDDIESLFAFGYYNWSNTGAGTNYANSLHGEQRTNTAGKVAGASAALTDNGQTFLVSNPKQMQFLWDTTLPMDLSFTFEFIRNKKYFYDYFYAGTASQQAAGTYGSGNSREVKRNAYHGTLAYGKLGKAHSYKVSYGYGSKGLASVVNYYSNSSFLADQKGHTIKAAYAVTDSLTLSGKFMSLKEVSNLDADGNAPGNTTTSNNASGRNHKVNYWELAAGVAF